MSESVLTSMQPSGCDAPVLEVSRLGLKVGGAPCIAPAAACSVPSAPLAGRRKPCGSSWPTAAGADAAACGGGGGRLWRSTLLPAPAPR